MNNFSPSEPATPRLTIEAAQLATIGLTAEEVGIFRRLHDSIFEQRLAPATRLTEEELAGVFGVNRMRIRRVLLALAHTGMIALPRGRGAQVASPTAAQAREVFAARQLIETALLEQALPVPKAEITRLRQMTETEAAALHAGDRAASIHLSGSFHIEVARICANPVVADIVAGLVTRSSLVIALYQRSGEHCCRANDHMLLVDALARADFSSAVALMRLHLSSIEAGLDLDMKPPGTPNLKEILGAG